MTIVLLLKESMILLGGKSIIFIKQMLKLIPIYKIIFIKKKKWGALPSKSKLSSVPAWSSRLIFLMHFFLKKTAKIPFTPSQKWQHSYVLVVTLTFVGYYYYLAQWISSIQRKPETKAAPEIIRKLHNISQ